MICLKQCPCPKVSHPATTNLQKLIDQAVFWKEYAHIAQDIIDCEDPRRKRKLLKVLDQYKKITSTQP